MIISPAECVLGWESTISLICPHPQGVLHHQQEDQQGWTSWRLHLDWSCFARSWRCSVGRLMRCVEGWRTNSTDETHTAAYIPTAEALRQPPSHSIELPNREARHRKMEPKFRRGELCWQNWEIPSNNCYVCWMLSRSWVAIRDNRLTFNITEALTEPPPSTETCAGSENKKQTKTRRCEMRHQAWGEEITVVT